MLSRKSVNLYRYSRRSTRGYLPIKLLLYLLKFVIICIITVNIDQQLKDYVD